MGARFETSWSVVSGPGPVEFADPTQLSTTAIFHAAGAYSLRLYAFDGELASNDELIIVVSEAVNASPSVEAGPDQTITFPVSAILSGSATDDGLPPGSTLVYSWSKVSGPGDVTFANAAAAPTTTTFSVPGTYVLRLTVSDSELTGSDDVTVTANPPSQMPPTAVDDFYTVVGQPAGPEISPRQVREHPSAHGAGDPSGWKPVWRLSLRR
jgi:hypothetical protein